MMMFLTMEIPNDSHIGNIHDNGPTYLYSYTIGIYYYLWYLINIYLNILYLHFYTLYTQGQFLNKNPGLIKEKLS